MSAIRNYIIIDDDPLNNMICSMVIKKTAGVVDIKVFLAPEPGLDYIQSEYGGEPKSTILFLDINMPPKTGWDFMEEYEKFSDHIKNQISVYILSSSVDPHDKNKASSYKSIKGFVSKPLEMHKVPVLING